MTTYWPDTKIVKSQGNAFDWRVKATTITEEKSWKLAVAAVRKSTKKTSSFTIYSKARASK